MYNYMRFRWGEGHDMDALMGELSEGFSVKRRDFPGNEVEVSLFKEDRVELMVTADRLRVHMNAHRVILSQIVEGSFTRRDMALREYVMAKYPRNRPTPFPWSFYFEPEFEVEEN
jgi:hypothetical protein